ncbi:MAG: hypothetical protein VW274_00360, partial [Thalassolituus sp.]
LDDVRAELTQSVQAEKAGFLFAERSQELANMAFSAESIEELATNAGLTVEESEMFSAMNGAGVAANENIRRIAFEDKMKLDRVFSELIETENGVLVFVVSDYIDAKAKPVAEVRAQIVATLSSQKALAAAETKANEIRDGADAEWREASATVRQSTDAPRPAHQKAFALAEGESDVVSSPEGYTVINVISIDRKSWEEMEATDELQASLRNQNARDDMVSFQAWSKANTVIEQ